MFSQQNAEWRARDLYTEVFGLDLVHATADDAVRPVPALGQRSRHTLVKSTLMCGYTLLCL